MKKHLPFIALVLSGAAAVAAPPADLSKYVDPFIGTADHGHVFLGANVPFGFIQAGPSQRVQGWDWCSGYHYSDSIIVGFSQTHLSGTGCGDLGDVTLFPTLDPESHTSTFSHDRERCTPGYYSVVLDKSGTLAEMTATERTASHRYTFAPADTAYLILDLEYGIGWDRPADTRIILENDSTISGWRHSRGWADNQKIFFTASFSKPILSCRVDTVGPSEIGLLAFKGSEKAPVTVEVRLALSAVSVDNARLNMAAETPRFDFDGTARRAREQWNSQLSKIDIATADDAARRKFYTALYHTMTAPSVYDDVNGDYRGADGEVGNTGGKWRNYTTFSLWDTYRAAHPLMTLIHPDRQNDIAATMVDIADRQGNLPVWHLHGCETNCMVGNPGVIVLGDLVLKGLVADTIHAYDAMKKSVLVDDRSLDAIKKYGYIPFDAPGKHDESVAKNMEYAIADDAVARVARRQNRADDASLFSRRGQAYRIFFDPETQFMRARDVNGKLREGPFDPFETTHHADDYCEGNAWQYIWLAPHDPKGLIELFGSKKAFMNKLDSLFVVEGSLGEAAPPDVTGLIGQYAHGNEPSHHIIYLYNYAGRPDKAAPLLRRVMNEYYTDSPAGLCGNEDVGQMSAWFVLSAMGIYQVEPAGGPFAIGSPLFDSAVIDLGNGRKFTILADNNSAENIYVKSATLNGRKLSTPFITYDDIVAGGTLRLSMTPNP